MARRVVSILHGPGGAPRPNDAALEANAFAVAEDVDLVLLLRDRGIELAQQRSHGASLTLAGVPLPDQSAAADLRGLVESGVPVYVGVDCLEGSGLVAADLVDGVRVVDADAVAALLRAADAVLSW